MLVGRAAERARLERLVEEARRGVSGAVAVVGEPGIGKTALLADAAAGADRLAVVRARGVESDAELPFAALLEICWPLEGVLDELPPHQRAVLRGALGLGPAVASTRLEVGASTLALLASAAETEPLLVLVDDAHWLDPASADALAFAARRLQADRVAIVFAGRSETRGIPSGIELLMLGPLPRDAARDLVDASGASVGAEAFERIYEASAGNPLALLELPVRPEALAPDRPEFAPIPIGKRLEDAFAADVRALAERAQRALLVAAANVSADPAVVGRALENLDLALADLEQPERRRLVAVAADAVTFRHPLVRSAVYHAAAAPDRRRAHSALAAVLEPGSAARAWHLAAAAVEPDEEVARELEQAAADARERSGYAAAAAAYERAARLSPSRERRLERLVAAAESAWLAGRTRHALALIEEALAHARDDHVRGKLLHLRGFAEHLAASPRVLDTLVEAAELLAPTDPHDAIVVLVEAIGSAFFVGNGSAALPMAERIRELADPANAEDQFFAAFTTGTALTFNGRVGEGAPHLRRALKLVSESETFATSPQHLVWASLAAWWSGNGALGYELSARGIDWARRKGATNLLPFALKAYARAAVIVGRWTSAYAAVSESIDLARTTGQRGQVCDGLGLLAWIAAAQGRTQDCREAAAEALGLAAELGLAWFETRARRALALDALAHGRLDEAGAELSRAATTLAIHAITERPALSPWAELVEVRARAGDATAARVALAEFEAVVAEAQDPLALALAARTRGLVADDAAFAAEFENALEAHERDEDVFARARTQLCYGERLRRAGRRIDARSTLYAALEVFDALGAAPWAERARSELNASGERLRRRDPTAAEQLTPQEIQIAAVIAEGATNKEAGERLFLSPKTIEWHLGRIYRKLGVRSRAELTRAVTEGRAALEPELAQR